MKKILTFILSLALMPITANVFAQNTLHEYVDDQGNIYEYSEGSVGYYGIRKITLGENSDVLSIPGEIDGLKFGGMNTRYDPIPAEIKQIHLPETISKNIKVSFYGMKNLETVTLPKNMEILNEDMFYGCGNLKNIEIPDTVSEIGTHCFKDCSALTSITLPQGVKRIGMGAFNGCTELRSVEWNKTAEMVYGDVFDGTKYLKEQPDGFLLIKNNTELYRYGADSKIAEIPEGVESIHTGAFADTDVEKIICPKSFTKIGNGAFAQADKLKEMEFKGEIGFMETAAFSGCASLEQPIIPEHVTEIPDDCFRACYGMKSAVIPESVQYIGKGAFAECINLSSLEVKGAARIEFAFGDTKLNKNNVKWNENAVYLPALNGDQYAGDPLGFLFDVPTQTEKPVPAETIAPKPTEVPAATPTTAPKESINVSNSNGKIIVALDHKAVNFPDAQPFVDENDRTQIPIRALAELLQFKVNWDGGTNTAILTKEDSMITIKVGSNIITKNNVNIQMDTTAKVLDDRTYIPLRFVGEALDYAVNWE